MRFLDIKTYNFRNLKDQTLTLNPGFNILVGSNGQGKTNFLEAIHYLIKGESFRPGKVEALLCHGTQASQVSGRIEVEPLDFDLSAKFSGHQRQFFVNSKRTPATRLKAHFPLVLFSPESLMTIKDGPGVRRQLIDELLLSHRPQLANLLRDYQQVLKSRNRVLKDYQSGEMQLNTAKDVLESLNERFITLATHLTAARIEALRAIQPEHANIYSRIDRSRPVDISVEYVISGRNHQKSSQGEIFDTMHKRLLELASAELAAGSSLVGPHKHEINFLFDGNDSRFYCSQGQQRALILAFKMAQIVYHRRLHKQSPILLLDDVMSELDQEKQRYLIEFLKDSTAQIVVTTTDATLPGNFADLEGRVFKIQEGTIRSC